MEHSLRDRDHWEDRGVGGRIILRWIFRKLDLRAWTGSMDPCERGNELSASLKCGEFLD